MFKTWSDVEKLILRNDRRQSKDRSSKAKSAPTTPHNEQKIAVTKHRSLHKDVIEVLHRHTLSLVPTANLRPNDNEPLSIQDHFEVNSKYKDMGSSKNKNLLKTVSRSSSVMTNQTSVETKEAVTYLPKSTKKFHKHFIDVYKEEGVINYYVCALVADILHQGTLFITERHFAFYSNIFGYTTKILIPISDVAAIKKKKTASFIPNAIGVQTNEGKKYVFSSLISRENTFKFMDVLWKKSKKISDSDSDPALMAPEVPIEEPHVDESSASGSGDSIREEETEESLKTTETVILKSKLPEEVKSNEEIKETGKENCQGGNFLSSDIQLSSQSVRQVGSFSVIELMKIPIQYLKNCLEDHTSATILLWSSLIVVVILILSAGYMMYRVEILTRQIYGEDHIDYNIVYKQILNMQQNLHAGTAEEVEKTLGIQLKQIAMMRQSLETLSYLFKKDFSTRETLHENVLDT